ncbi:hypothetical protein M3Y99_01570800 [Aphelenchoides fujianensis]|nr:hypothetical protein M3Y99_01570800 [Aphelenchoides fujianensis]
MVNNPMLSGSNDEEDGDQTAIRCYVSYSVFFSLFGFLLVFFATNEIPLVGFQTAYFLWCLLSCFIVAPWSCGAKGVRYLALLFAKVTIEVFLHGVYALFVFCDWVVIVFGYNVFDNVPIVPHKSGAAFFACVALVVKGYLEALPLVFIATTR